jgi:alginate O-acetyltransferase complex protein AlgI
VLFVEFRFLFFFLLVLGVHWALRHSTARKLWLLAASYLFYAAWDWRFLSLLLLSTATDYVAALRIDATDVERSRSRWLAFSVVVNLAILGTFKYLGFFSSSFASLMSSLGVHVGTVTLDIVLPVGISFYTFQTLSYTIDVHRRRMSARRSVLDVALFVAFFPQLVAGPIMRARDLLPQMESPRRFAGVDVRGCLVLLLVGFFKKACVADNVATLIDPYFAHPAAFDAASAWLAQIGFLVQVYCDFSGYSDMAVGLAGLLGYRLCLNFDGPYLARNIRELWRRWHISLTDWFRDYVYTPLRGSDHTGLRWAFAVFATMTICGLWHGATWNFVVFGALNGIALLVYAMWSRAQAAAGVSWRVPAVLATVLTFATFALAGVPFRAANLPDSVVLWRSMLLFDSAGGRTLSPEIAVLIGALALLHYVCHRRRLGSWWRHVADWRFGLVYGVAWSLALALRAVGYQPFVYLRF